jgi:hypothetical protein
MTYPGSPQIVVGDCTLLVALTTLKQSDLSRRMPDVLPQQPFCPVRTGRQAARCRLAYYPPAAALVAAGHCVAVFAARGSDASP